MLRTVFLGTSDFAAAILRDLSATGHRPALVLTRPDRPRGRGRRLTPPPVAEVARELELTLEQPESINDPTSVELITAAAPEVVCVCAFGALIREPLLSRHPMVNVHPSLLPRWRGAAPIERAIMAGDESTGVSIMALTSGLDSGPVYLQAKEPIAQTDTFGTLSIRLRELATELLVRVLDRWPEVEAHEQDELGASYAAKIEPEDRRLEPALSAGQLARVVRALHPHIGAYLELDCGERLAVHEVAVGPAVELAPGELVLSGSRPVLVCHPGTLELLTVQPPGRRAMSGEDYLRGRRG